MLDFLLAIIEFVAVSCGWDVSSGNCRSRRFSKGWVTSRLNLDWMVTDVGWPWMAVSRIARYLCCSWASCCRLWTIVHETRTVAHVSQRSYSPFRLDLEPKVDSFSGFWHFICAIYSYFLTKFWFSGVRWPRCAKPTGEWSRMQNLRRMGDNCGRNFRLLWVKGHKIMRRSRGCFLFVVYLQYCSPTVLIRRYSPLKMLLIFRSRRKTSTKIGSFANKFLRERGYPKFWTYIFISRSRPNMWQVLVEFRSVSSDGSWRRGKTWGWCPSRGAASPADIVI